MLKMRLGRAALFYDQTGHYNVAYWKSFYVWCLREIHMSTTPQVGYKSLVGITTARGMIWVWKKTQSQQVVII